MVHKHKKNTVKKDKAKTPSATVKTKHTEPAAATHEKMDHSKMQHGDSPKMGMEGHNHHAMMIADFKKRFYVVLFLTVPIMLLSPMIQQFMRVDWQFTGSNYVLFALSSIVLFYGGLPFFKR